MIDELFSIKNLTVWYEKEKPILKNLNMSINKNQVVGLSSRNGSEKTTLFKVIASILSTNHVENFQWLKGKANVESNNFKLNRLIIFDEPVNGLDFDSIKFCIN